MAEASSPLELNHKGMRCLACTFQKKKKSLYVKASLLGKQIRHDVCNFILRAKRGIKERKPRLFWLTLRGSFHIRSLRSIFD